MPYSAIGHSILVLAILAHLIAGYRPGVAVGVVALILAWIIESMGATRTAWVLVWALICLTGFTWLLYFFPVL